MSNSNVIKIELYKSIMRSINGDFLMFDNNKLESLIDWYSKISARKMLLDRLNHFDNQILKRIISLTT